MARLTELEEFLCEQLPTKLLRPLGRASGGYISSGASYETDSGSVFVKHSTEPQALEMFEGEKASLEALLQTTIVHVPKPIKVVEVPSGGWLMMMEHVNMRGLSSENQQVLGEQLARLHLHNISAIQRSTDTSHTHTYTPISQFGFHCSTSCGLIPMPNDWKKDWVEFYCQLRLEKQLALLEMKYGDREAAELWSLLQRKVPLLFEGVQVQPSLLHGDLWAGNAGEDDNGPVIYDPASFYGHHEFDLAITHMFGGFSKMFYDSYHKLIPKAPGFTARSKLYLLFHYLNHWNHFGGGYRNTSVSLMKELAKP